MAKSKLEKTIDAATKLGLVLTGKETQKQLDAMIKEAKAAPTEPQKMEMEVTEEYMAAHPELREQGIEVGDLISVDAPEGVDTKPKAAAPAPKGAMAVLKNGNEYVRTYGPDQKDELEEFLSKSAKYSAVPDASVEELEVPYDVKDPKTGVVDHTSKRFENKEEAIRFRNEHRSVAMVVAAKKKK